MFIDQISFYFSHLINLIIELSINLSIYLTLSMKIYLLSSNYSNQSNNISNKQTNKLKESPFNVKVIYLQLLSLSKAGFKGTFSFLHLRRRES